MLLNTSACCPNKAPSIYNFAVQAIGRRLTENSSTTLDAQHSRTRWGPMHPGANALGIAPSLCRILTMFRLSNASVYQKGRAEQLVQLLDP